MIDQRLEALVPPPGHPGDMVCEAMREGILGKGKRIRPLLLVAVCEGFEQDPMSLLDVGCALEMVHVASLFLDDLPCMDDAVERRGRPAIHMQFGEDIAVLASVALLSLAFRTIAGASEVSPAMRAQLVTLVADTIGPHGLVKGQFQDLRADPASGDADALARVNELKTGVLLRAAMLAPAVVAQADALTLAAIARCAHDIGHAFQLRDDLDDQAFTSAGDLCDIDGHATLVTLLGLSSATARFNAHMESAQSNLHQLFPHDRMLGALMQGIRVGESGETSTSSPRHRHDSAKGDVGVTAAIGAIGPYRSPHRSGFKP